jgi:hypothetical protein
MTCCCVVISRHIIRIPEADAIIYSMFQFCTILSGALYDIVVVYCCQHCISVVGFISTIADDVVVENAYTFAQDTNIYHTAPRADTDQEYVSRVNDRRSNCLTVVPDHTIILLAFVGFTTHEYADASARSTHTRAQVVISTLWMNDQALEKAYHVVHDITKSVIALVNVRTGEIVIRALFIFTIVLEFTIMYILPVSCDILPALTNATDERIDFVGISYL